MWDVIVLIPDHHLSIYFADDTSLYIIVDNRTTAADCLNKDLNKISRWAATWLVTFNPTNTEAVLFSSKLDSHLF